MLKMPDVRCWVPGPMVSPAGHPRGLVPFIARALIGSVHVARMPCLAQIGLGLCMLLVYRCYARPCRRAAGARKAPKCPPPFSRHPHSRSGCSIRGAFGQAGGLCRIRIRTGGAAACIAQGLVCCYNAQSCWIDYEALRSPAGLY